MVNNLRYADGWMASPIGWMWVWVNSAGWWWTARPGVLQFMGSQRVGHNWATELNWTEVTSVISRVLLSVTPWTVACQASLSMGFYRQGYKSGLPFPSPGDLPNPGTEPVSYVSALAGRFFTTSTTWMSNWKYLEKYFYPYFHNFNFLTVQKRESKSGHNHFSLCIL